MITLLSQSTWVHYKNTTKKKPEPKRKPNQKPTKQKTPLIRPLQRGAFAVFVPVNCVINGQSQLKSSDDYHAGEMGNYWSPSNFPQLLKKKSPLFLALLEIFLIPIFYQPSLNSFWYQPFATTVVTSPLWKQGHSHVIGSQWLKIHLGRELNSLSPEGSQQ